MFTDTFNLFTDSGLTTAFGGIYDLIHETDLSDNPQDFTLYFGSLGSGGGDTADRKTQAVSDPGVDEITLTIADILPEWEVATAYAEGDAVHPVTPDGFMYRCTTAGTSHATTEPVWAGMGAIGSTIVDNGCVWTKVAASHEITEIALSLTEIGLDTAIPGASLALGNTVTSGTANKITVYLRVVNAVTTVSNNTATPELGLTLNSIVETEV